MQRQDAFVVGYEPIVDRIPEFERLLALLAHREIAELLQRLDVRLGELREFLARKLAVVIRVEPLRREGRKHLVEGPCVAYFLELAVGRIDQFALRRHPHMWMGARARDTGEQEERGERRST